MVKIAGATGPQQFVQLSGGPGRRTLLVTAATQDRVIDSRRIDVEVLAADSCSPLPILDVRGDPAREATGLWSIRNTKDVHRSGTYYEWHYGAKTPMITREPFATISYADLFKSNETFRVFHMRLVVRYADQSQRTAERSVTVWNRYALAKQRGLVQPRVVYDFRASTESDHLVGRARIINNDTERIHFTSQQIQWLLNVPDALAEPGQPTPVDVVIPQKSFTDIEHKVRLDSLPKNAFGFVVILRGDTRSGHTAHAAAYFEHHVPLANGGVRVINASSQLAVLQDLRAAADDKSRKRFTRTELQNLARKLHAEQETQLPLDVGALFKPQKPLLPLGGSLDGLECVPDQTPPEEGLACQLTDDWDWVAVPGRFVNARMGDVLLSPGSGGPILGVLRHVSPPQIFSHSAIMTENYYELRHSTASESWLQDQKLGSGSDGLDPDALQYIWPGTISQTPENAMEGERFNDPDNKTDAFGTIKTYTLSAMTNGGLDPGNEIIDPIVVKPDPLIEAERHWVRPNLHRVANAAKSINGHYRFYGYTDGHIAAEDSGSYLAPTRAGWWASGTRPTVCSALAWAAANSLRDPEVRLEGRGRFTDSSDIEDTDVAADVDFRTRDGLYFYTEDERKVAGDWLYNYFYNLVAEVAETSEWGPFAVPLSDAASDTANQICNAFAFDWTGWSDVYDDEAKDSDRWKNPGIGRAVSPDNIMNWDSPTEFDGRVVRGLYGFTEPLIYREPYLEYRRISRWRRVPTTGTLDGDVRYKGTTVAGAIVNVGGQSLTTHATGSFSVELPTGEYHVQAGKFVAGGYAEGDAFTRVVNGTASHVVVELRDPPELFRRLTLRGTMALEDYETFGANQYATRNFARNSDIGPYRTHDLVGWTERMGGEIRVELTFDIDWKTDLSIDVDWHARFFEGATEFTSDLESERSGTINVPRDELRTLTISIWNEDEDEPQDRADITLDLTNSVQP